MLAHSGAYRLRHFVCVQKAGSGCKHEFAEMHKLRPLQHALEFKALRACGRSIVNTATPLLATSTSMVEKLWRKLSHASTGGVLYVRCQPRVASATPEAVCGCCPHAVAGAATTAARWHSPCCATEARRARNTPRHLALLNPRASATAAAILRIWFNSVRFRCSCAVVLAHISDRQSRSYSAEPGNL